MIKVIVYVLLLLGLFSSAHSSEKSLLLQIIPMLGNLNLQQESEVAACKVNGFTAPPIDFDDQEQRELYEFLRRVDPEHGLQLFLCDPQDVSFWLDMDADMSTVLHETNHFFDASLSWELPPSGPFKYFLLGQVFTTTLNGQTQNYSIVGETLPESLKTTMRYETYIEESRQVSGNRFEILLDELNAYTGDAYFQLQYMKNRVATPLPLGQFQIDGMVNFMVYLQYYLHTARLNYPGTYGFISGAPEVTAYIQYVWSLAEEILDEAYIYLATEQPEHFFDTFFGASGLDHLRVAYSSEALAELDLLGIEHVADEHWQESYYAYSQQGQ